MTDLLEQLRAITRTGMPLPSGLRAASLELQSAPLQATLRDLATLLDQGRGLDAALLAESRRFPAHLQGLVKAGTRSGRLADVLGEMIRGSNLGHELRRKIGVALAYPVIILGVMLVLTIFVCHLSNEVIAGMMTPSIINPNRVGPTAVAMTAVVQFVAAYSLRILGGLLALVGVGWACWRFALAPPARRRLFQSLPLLGPMARFVALAEFCHLAALLIDAETPLPEAIGLAGASVGDAAVAEDCGRVAASVAGGEPLSSALQGWTHLPAGLGQLLAWGEGQQSLGEALRFAGEMFESCAETQATFSRQVLGAVLLILIMWWLGFAIATVYLPMVYAIQALSG